MLNIRDVVKDRISRRHAGDNRQLEVIFSDCARLLVEAPAGYGKTNTMVSKIAYMLATQQIPYPKRLLALTFSVNAAYKIKKEVTQQVPDLLRETGLTFNVAEKVIVSNYHGFCRSVLKKYGFIFEKALFDIDQLFSIDDRDPQALMSSVKGLAYEDAVTLSNYSERLKKVDVDFLTKNIAQYNRIVIQSLLPRRAVPYNAILTLTIELFNSYPHVLKFYHKYFSAILVDEYQDTNALSHWLLSLLITENSKVILLGDSLQRIYGFIGAVPNLLQTSETEFGLTRIGLNKNHRFASNPKMLLLDHNIRCNAENPYHPNVSAAVSIEVARSDDQRTESSKIVERIHSLIDNSPIQKVAILVKQRGPNTNMIVNALDNANVSYFYGLFTDEDAEYIGFHKRCAAEFLKLITIKDAITRPLGILHVKRIRKSYGENPSALENALITLLGIFWSKVFTEYIFLSNEDRVSLVRDTFEFNSLKQYVEFTNTQVVISTVHAAKGLEWDFVILPDMEQYQFPNWPGLCGQCTCKGDCRLQITNATEQSFLEELSIFYVAVTRAKKQVYFSASATRLDAKGISRPTNLSCFLRLPGIGSVGGC